MIDHDVDPSAALRSQPSLGVERSISKLPAAYASALASTSSTGLMSFKLSMVTVSVSRYRQEDERTPRSASLSRSTLDHGIIASSKGHHQKRMLFTQLTTI